MLFISNKFIIIFILFEFSDNYTLLLIFAHVYTTIFMDQLKYNLNCIYICFYKCIQFPLMHFHHFSDTAQSDLITLGLGRIFFNQIRDHDLGSAIFRTELYSHLSLFIAVL